MAESRRKVLMLAYVFPPFFSVGGSIRAVKFARYLPALGWEPLVLTIDDREETVSQKREGSASLLQELSPQTAIYRTRSGEPPASLQQKGRQARRSSRLAAVLVNALSWLRRVLYRYLLLPDAHIVWLPAALRTGQHIVDEEHPAVLWATCPPHSTALIAALLKRRTGLPLVLDYRDDWIDTPWFRSKPRLVRWLERRLESWAVQRADRVVAVTEASRQAFLRRYPRQRPAKFVLIPNGCDLADFAAVRELPVEPNEAFQIAHAGLLSIDQGWHRSPEPFFDALRLIAQQRPEVARHLQVTFTGRLPEQYRQHMGEDGLDGMVREAGFLPREGFQRLLRQADLLLAINYEGFGTLIPGKLYEYWAVGHAPILLLDGPGAARRLVQQHGLGFCVKPDDVAGIAQAILEAHDRYAAGTPLWIDTAGIEQYDRKLLARRLADLLETVRAGEHERKGG